MDLPDPDIVSKWLVLWKKLSTWLKVILPVVAIAIAVICFYLYFFGPVPRLIEKNAGLEDQITGLKSNLADADSELSKAESDKSRLRDQITGLEENLAEAESDKSSLRDEKNKLQTENQLLKTIADPVQEMLKQLYPKMKIAAAIAKMAEDVKKVHSLATRDVYKPLAAQKKKEFIGKLQALLGRYTSFTHTVTICCQNGNVTRAKVAYDLKQYLEEAGFEVELSSGMFSQTVPPSNIWIGIHPDDTEFVNQFIDAVNPLYINEHFQGLTQETISRGCFEITIHGDPLFTELGVVEF